MITGRERVDSETLAAPDGGSCRLIRFPAPDGATPVVLIPGMFDNHRLFVWPDGGGLAPALADAGFAPWIVERRVAGTPGRVGWVEAAYQDLPRAQRRINAASGGSAAFWVAHSFGGVVLARALSDSLDVSAVRGVVLVNSAADLPPPHRWLLSAGTAVARRLGHLPSRRWRLGPEDESPEALADALAWLRSERDSGAVTAPLRRLNLPLLAITSPRDPITPARRCTRLARAFGGEDVRIQSASRRNGFRRNHGHESPLLHRRAPDDTIPFVVDWLRVRDVAGPCRITAEQPPAGRRRIVLTAALAAPPEAVFDVLVQHWATVWKIRSETVRPGVDPAVPAGLRSVRRVHILPRIAVDEEVTGYRPPRTLAYSTRDNCFIHGHHGRVEITATPGGSRIDYQMVFTARRLVPSRLLAAVLRGKWRYQSIPALHRLLADRAVRRSAG